MADKYFHKSTDVSTQACSFVSDSADIGTKLYSDGSGALFNGEDKDYQRGGDDTTNVFLPNYMVNGKPIKIVKKGYFAKLNIPDKANWSTNTAGTYTLTRTDSTLTIGSSSFSASSFKDGVVPCEIIICIVGPGGGGGGNGYSEYKKDKFHMIPGGAGGGGGVSICRIDIKECSTLQLKCGAGGAVGSNGGSPGSGGTGGGASNPQNLTANSSEAANSWVKILVRNGTSVNIMPMIAAGGGGGGGGSGNGDGEYLCGSSGLGGYASELSGSYGCKSGTTGFGGKGGSASDTKHTNGPQIYWQAYNSEDATRICTGKYNGTEHKLDIDNSASFYSGGCSMGYGTYHYEGNSSPKMGYLGGGGGAGLARTAGANGAIYIWWTAA